MAMKDFRDVATGSDALLINDGKRRLGKVRYKHTTETLTVSRIRLIICMVTLLIDSIF
jgi:hypothetical protein